MAFFLVIQRIRIFISSKRNRMNVTTTPDIMSESYVDRSGNFVNYIVG